MANITVAPIAEELTMEDYVLVVVDGCVHRISYEDFIKNITLGGFDLCAAVQNCIEGIGVFPDSPEPEDEPPHMDDILLFLPNRTEDYFFSEEQFEESYTDPEGDELSKIRIVGGELEGFSFEGLPLYVGQEIDKADLSKIEYDAQDTDEAYQQYLLIKVIAENGGESN